MDLDDIDAKSKPIVLDDDEDAEEFGLGGANAQVWLIKVPKFLAEKWTAVQNEGQDLGSISIPTPTNDPKRPPSMGSNNSKADLKLPSAPWSSDIPKNYTLSFTNMAPSNEYVFTEEKATGRAKEIVGRVIKEGGVAPVIDDEYRQLMQKRAQKVTDKKRNIKMIDVKGDRGHTWITPVNDVIREKGFGITVCFLAKKRPQQEKKERVERTELVNMIFDAFQKYPHWTFKGLVERTQQPQAWLKEVLNDLAILHKRGPYVGTYELKPEFKGQGGSSSAMDTSAQSRPQSGDAGGAAKDSSDAEDDNDTPDDFDADDEIL
ncbi:transcription initiation factor IIF, beta subunit-domain-containing protein [Phlyctochytrium arcticum]|nr:transcription initiation factor IIF, beta subunit-domain-containing protein [Phlyctochytrium arcticum]